MRRTVIQAMMLSIPMLIFFGGYLFNHSENLYPTGFIQYDNVSYVAYGKQYLDEEKGSLFYSNPFNDSNGYPPIYFQTQFLFFGLLMKLGLPPGWILIPFTIICSIICFVLLIKIYDVLVSEKKYRIFNLWLFAWGGGLLVIAGILAHYLLGKEGSVRDHLFLIDPEWGWWGLSFGRALFFSCEAYYHALFLSCIYFLLKKKWLLSAIFLLLLSLSHPFTGVELAAIICLWCIWEWLVNRKEIPLAFVFSSLAILGFHLFYYMAYLEQYPEHRSVSEQYTLRWRLGIYRIIPAYGIVGALAIVSIWRASLRKFLSIRHNRIFLSWFIVAFLLANHELFMTARQPIHFTRGYVWTSLFLLGLPALIQLNGLIARKWKHVGLILLGAVLLLDNFTWIVELSSTKATQPFPTYITSDQRRVLEEIGKTSSNQSLVISRDNTVAYLTSVYSSAYPWYSHPYTTPFASKKKQAQDSLFLWGKVDSVWYGREVHFVLTKQDSVAMKTLSPYQKESIFKTGNYVIYRFRSLRPQ